MTSTVTSLTHLAPGEALHLPLDERTTLQLVAGSVLLREPLRWLADTMLAPAVNLSEGQCHRLAQAGWVVVQAGAAGAQILSHRDLTGWQRLGQWVSRRRIGSAGASMLRRAL